MSKNKTDRKKKNNKIKENNHWSSDFQPACFLAMKPFKNMHAGSPRTSGYFPLFRNPSGHKGRTHVYSIRRAIIGSTFVARRAGIQQARNATVPSNNAINEKVTGSVAPMLNNKFEIKRVKANAASNPMTTPLIVNFIP